jgi:hypothetical protein
MRGGPDQPAGVRHGDPHLVGDHVHFLCAVARSDGRLVAHGSIPPVPGPGGGCRAGPLYVGPPIVAVPVGGLMTVGFITLRTPKMPKNGGPFRARGNSGATGREQAKQCRAASSQRVRASGEDHGAGERRRQQRGQQHRQQHGHDRARSDGRPVANERSNARRASGPCGCVVNLLAQGVGGAVAGRTSRSGPASRRRG